MHFIKLDFVKKLEREFSNSAESLIQVVIGARQVGKTTGIKQLLSELPNKSYLYCSADAILPKPADWLFEQWNIATSSGKTLLVVDEIQKVENWSALVKQLWDEQLFHGKKLDLILLGSSSLNIQRGLSESLAGRFLLHKVYHWNAEESKAAYNLDLDTYLTYGGYPGSYSLLSNRQEWLDYINDSIIEAVIGKDILSNARVLSPALFKQCFDIVCSYPAQEISYTKLLGQLHSRGNTDQIKYYLELLEGAFLIKQLFKYSNRKVIKRSSSPKLLPMCPSLFTVGIDADLNKEEKGRAFELAVGTSLIRLPGRTYYWRERNYEVDFVYEYGKNLYGIEVKSSSVKNARGLMKFKEKFPKAHTLIITPDNFDNLNNLLIHH
jgi:uncharacterized protein